MSDKKISLKQIKKNIEEARKADINSILTPVTAGHSNSGINPIYADGWPKGQSPKRKPDSNGVLPLTEEELQEFENKFAYDIHLFKFTEIVKTSYNVLQAIYKDDDRCVKKENILNYKAILWLADRFELNGE